MLLASVYCAWRSGSGPICRFSIQKRGQSDPRLQLHAISFDEVFLDEVNTFEPDQSSSAETKIFAGRVGRVLKLEGLGEEDGALGVPMIVGAKRIC